MQIEKRLSSRVDRLSESKTIKMSRLSREMQEKGIDVINLSLGEPDFVTPEHIRTAAKKAIDDGFTFYPPVGGYSDLRKAIADNYAKQFQTDISPQQVVVSCGAKQSLANVVMSLIDFDDDVLVPAPYWVTYPEQIRLAGGIPRYVHANVEQDFKITAAQLDDALRPETRLFVFSSPSNPTGSVYSEKELAAMAEVFQSYPNTVIISDEIYEHINFIGEHHSLYSHAALRDRTVIVNGVSKGYAMTGWRIGYIVAPKWIAGPCEKMQGQFTSAPSSISQRAALQALTTESSSVTEMKEEFKKRRDYMLSRLTPVEGLKLNKPEGAFYLFMDVSGLFGKKAGDRTIDDSEDFATYVLEEAHVSLVPGDAFGSPDCIRLSYAAGMVNLEKAADRIIAAIGQLQ